MSRFGLVALVLGLGGFADSARAQECAEDTECPRGFSCTMLGSSTCAAAPRRPAADGGAAEDLPVPPPDTCVPRVIKQCQPGPCMADSDCASGMVCHEYSTGTCSSPAQPPVQCMNGICPDRDLPEPTCTETTARMCVPRHTLPCQQASDCGAGFTCEPRRITRCSGSAGAGGASSGGAPTPDPAPPQPDDQGSSAFAPPADAGVDKPSPGPAPEMDAGAPLPPDGSCTTVESEERYCRVIEVSCNVDADCPGEFSCHPTRGGTPAPEPACLRAPSPPDAGAADGGASCGDADRALPAPPSSGRCLPPYSDVSFPTRGGVAVDESGSAGKGEGGEPPPVAPQPQPTNGNLVPVDDDTTGTHVEACNVRSPGAAGAGGSLWIGLMSLAAAWVRSRRRTR